MPMMKTASVGTTSIINIQSYLVKAQRQERARHQLEWDNYASGRIQLSTRQIGYLKDYLGEGSRGLAIDVSDDLPVRNWAQQMDLTRALHQHDKPVKQGRSRSYYHFILSPDPNDDCSLATLRDYAKAWCEENFRANERLHEYAIVYHDDNVKGVLHAHIVVNVTNKSTGKKLHLGNEQTVALQISAQDIGRRYGLAPIRERMQSTIGARTEQPIYLDRREREILNKGGYSWKWELRKFISDIAPLCRDFDDFKWKMNRAGYDVVLSEKTGYLTYTHRNGTKVKDSRLGARFYLESLERVFNHQIALSDQAYTSWELIKISKGEVPWKEEIRRAIDAVAPTVMSVPELQRELNARYGIRLTVNRRGITYHHASGFKTRDIGLGLRYTTEGLRQSAVLGMSLPYPTLEEIEQSARTLTRHYMPRGVRSVGGGVSESAAAQAVYRDVCGLMLRYGLLRLDDIPTALEARYEALRGVKIELVDIRNQVMKWNHLAVLQSQLEKDAAFLKDENHATDPAAFNEALLRYKRNALYLKEQAGGVDPRSMQKEMALLYQSRLGNYQSQIAELDQDNLIYQNYLVGQPFRLVDDLGSVADVGVKELVAVSQTLSKYHIRDFFHLEKVMSDYETRLDLAKYRLSKAEEKKRSLDSLRSDIRDIEELKPLLPQAEALQKHPTSLGLEVQMFRLQEASRRLSMAGVRESDFLGLKREHHQALRACSEMRKECARVFGEYTELKEALSVCQRAAESIKRLQSREQSVSHKSFGGDEGAFISENGREGLPPISASKGSESRACAASAIPFEEARKRHQERLRNAPERSKRIINDQIR